MPLAWLPEHAGPDAKNLITDRPDAEKFMTLARIINAIEGIAPLKAAAPWDLSGLQVASARTSVNALAVCLDPTPASIRAALDQGAQCVLSHHPLCLKPALPNRLDAYHEALRLLFQADVPLYAAHTSLDVNPQGPAGWPAKELGLSEISVLEPVGEGSAFAHLGYGLAGNLPQPQTLAQILSTLGRHASFSALTVSGNIPEQVSRLAYCAGSGSSLLEAAQRAGAQLFITGDVKYHTALTTGICLCDAGHHSLEEEMMRRMSLLLQEELADMHVFFVPSVSPFRPVVLP